MTVQAYLANNHNLLDGNKRVGLRRSRLFLRINGYALEDTQTELISRTQIATNHPILGEGVEWRGIRCLAF
jgi:prophage maintenance system killer protein